jgi:hypothetical protein
LKKKYNHCAFLNKEGKETWGEIFPDGTVPVKNFIPTYVRLGGKSAQAFMVDLSALSEEVYEAVLEKIADMFNAPLEAVRQDFNEKGLPLRVSLTNGSWTDSPRGTEVVG